MPKVNSRFHPDRANNSICHSYFGDMWHTLPDRAKNYIADIEQSCDQTGNIQIIASLGEQRDALIEKILELKSEIELLNTLL